MKMAQGNNLPNGGTKLPDYSQINIMTEDEMRHYREITENSLERIRARIDGIRASGKSIIEMIADLSYNPYSKRDIVAYILQNGPYIIHFLKPSTLLDEQGNDLRDFVESDNNLYFQEITVLLKELEKPENAALARVNADYIKTVNRAVEMWSDLLEMQQEFGEMLACGDDEPGTMYLDDDCDVEYCVRAYDMAKNFILSCGRREMEKVASKGNYEKLLVKSAVKRYIAEQKELLQSYFRTYMRDVSKLIPLVDWDGSNH